MLLPASAARSAGQTRGFSLSSIVSISSPIWMSLYLPRPIPAAKSVLTSVTSSLNRRSDSMARLSPTTTPSRMTRAFALRVIVPLRTMTPAMLPNFEERNTSRISATPDCTTSYSGVRRPLSGDSMSSRGESSTAAKRTSLPSRAARAPTVAAGPRGVAHGVEAPVDALARGALAGLAIRTDVEADDGRVVDRRQVDVGLGDGAHTAVQDAQLDRVVDLDLEQRLLERLDGTGDVTLDDEVERIDLALFECTGEVLERDALAGLGQLGVALDGFALLGDLPRGAVLLGHEEGVTGTRHRRETLHLHGARRSGLLDRFAVLVVHGTHAAVGGSRHDRISHPQRSRLDEHGRDRTAALVE